MQVSQPVSQTHLSLSTTASLVSANQVATTVAVAKHAGQMTQQTLTTAQLLAQAGLTVQTGAAGTSQSPVATLVKTVAVPGGVTQGISLPVTGVIPQVPSQFTNKFLLCRFHLIIMKEHFLTHVNKQKHCFS